MKSKPLMVDGHTVPYAVLGHPVSHTLSPVMHNAAFRELGMNAVYLGLDVLPEKVGSTVEVLKSAGFGGLNITVPLKETVCKSLNSLDESARLLGAVNTIQFRADGATVGHNTDGRGFVKAIREEFGTALKGLDVLVVGSGGAGRAVAINCIRESAANVTITDVDDMKVHKLVAEIVEKLPGGKVARVNANSGELLDISRSSDLIIHCTPLGMKPKDKSVFSSKYFKKGQMVFDLIYMHPRTVFMKQAQAAGAMTANGLGMLLHQGVLAFEIWTGRKPPVAVMRKALEKAVYGR